MRERGLSKYGILDRLLVGISDMLGVIWLLKRMPKTGMIVEDAVIASKTKAKPKKTAPRKTAKTKAQTGRMR
jgi:dolichol-phosphate mannosyltransferase